MRYAWLVLLAIGCYEAPDYAGTHFKCDDNHGCPDGQQCVAGVCGGNGSGSNMPDAATSSAGVICGASVCTGGQKCCADFLSGPHCIAAGASCTAGISATCDGVEDCSGGACCANGSVTVECQTTCSGQTICRDAADCVNSGASMCCPSIGTMEPWGKCSNVCP